MDLSYAGPGIQNKDLAFWIGLRDPIFMFHWVKAVLYCSDVVADLHKPHIYTALLS